MNKDEAIDYLFGCKGGSPVEWCDCGRAYYDSSGEYMDEGELEEYEKKDKCIPCVSPTFIDVPLLGHRVFGCKCDWELKLLKFLDSEVEGIKEYYKAKACELKKQSEVFNQASK